MNERILVAYATTHGSTREIAEQVAEMLRHAGSRTVDLLPARQVRSLQGYQAVILGSALYMFHLHKDALRFLGLHRTTLEGGLPLAFFAGGLYDRDGAEAENEVRRELDGELAKFPWLRPASMLIVGGRHDPESLRFPWSLVPVLRHAPARDLRDWDAIRAWAATLNGTLLHTTGVQNAAGG